MGEVGGGGGGEWRRRRWWGWWQWQLRHLHPLHADGRRLLQEADDVDVAREAGDGLGGDAVARDGGGVGAVGEQELGDAL